MTKNLSIYNHRLYRHNKYELTRENAIEAALNEEVDSVIIVSPTQKTGRHVISEYGFSLDQSDQYINIISFNHIQKINELVSESKVTVAFIYLPLGMNLNEAPEIANELHNRSTTAVAIYYL